VNPPLFAALNSVLNTGTIYWRVMHQKKKCKILHPALALSVELGSIMYYFNSAELIACGKKTKMVLNAILQTLKEERV
jgi:hypothetical protein